MNWIDSIELMKRTGLSRATLNNYIRMGFLPRPSVRRPEGRSNVRRVGFFPIEAMTTIEKIRNLKKEGMSMQEVRAILEKGDTADDRENVERIERVPDISATADLPFGTAGSVHPRVEPSKNTSYPPHPEDLRKNGDEIQLTLQELAAPAYLVNNNFEVDWINRQAEELIFRAPVAQIQEAEGRNVFRLLFENALPETGDKLTEGLLPLHMKFFRARHPKSFLDKVCEGMGSARISALQSQYERVGAVQGGLHESYISMLSPSGTKQIFHVHAIVYREGVFFVYAPPEQLIAGIAELLCSRGKIIQELLKRRLPTLVSFCVLVADLQDSVRICAELPPDEYFELINQIWRRMECAFKKYYGTYGKHAGDGMVYYFLKENDADYIMNSIRCATELREKMRELSGVWREKKHWFNDLHLNIGINEGQEFFGRIPAAPTIEFTALGDSVNYAGRLSDFARNGSIWVTKNLVNKITVEQRASIRFGIRKSNQGSEIFLETLFSRIMDMIKPDHPKYPKFADIATLAVTEVVDVR